MLKIAFSMTFDKPSRCNFDVWKHSHTSHYFGENLWVYILCHIGHSLCAVCTYSFSHRCIKCIKKSSIFYGGRFCRIRRRCCWSLFVPTQYQGWNFIPFKSYEPQSFDESGNVAPSLLSGYHYFVHSRSWLCWANTISQRTFYSSWMVLWMLTAFVKVVLFHNFWCVV
jgi:hypothetical protein